MVKFDVAVGVLFNENGEVLIGQRTVQDRYFKQWEFPGGKIEPGEQPEHALVRELKEELGVRALKWQLFLEMHHEYPDRHVHLHVYRVTEYSGTPEGKESQAIQWILPAELENIDFLSGNQKIVAAVQGLN